MFGWILVIDSKLRASFRAKDVIRLFARCVSERVLGSGTLLVEQQIHLHSICMHPGDRASVVQAGVPSGSRPISAWPPNHGGG